MYHCVSAYVCRYPSPEVKARVVGADPSPSRCLERLQQYLFSTRTASYCCVAGPAFSCQCCKLLFESLEKINPNAKAHFSPSQRDTMIHATLHHLIGVDFCYGRYNYSLQNFKTKNDLENLKSLSRCRLVRQVGVRSVCSDACIHAHELV